MDWSSPSAAAYSALGRTRPLHRVIALRAEVTRQAAVAAMLLVATLGAWAIGAPWAMALTVSAAILLMGLVLLAVALRAIEARRALEVIAGGGEAVPVEAVQRERQRLSSSRTQASLARAYQRILEQTTTPRLRYGSPRPWIDSGVMTAVTPELRSVIARLRCGDAHPRGVALAEHLLSDGLGVLYGHDETALRTELDRTLLLMSASASPQPD